MSSRTISAADSSSNWYRVMKQGFSLIELLIVIAIVVALVALFFPVTRNARGAARRMQCQNNLKQIGLALHNYHSTYGSLPPAFTTDEEGNRLHSWRTLLLPFLEQRDLYKRIDLSKPWNDPKNVAAVEKHIPSAYRCPASENGNRTQYLAVIDPEGCFTGSTCVSFPEITDGLPGTLLVMEVPEGSGVEWMNPVDADWGLVEAWGGQSKMPHYDVCQYLYADGAVGSSYSSRTPVIGRWLLTIAAGDANEDGLD